MDFFCISDDFLKAFFLSKNPIFKSEHKIKLFPFFFKWVAWLMSTTTKTIFNTPSNVL